ncbi:YkgJ family cysteine cluster protein [Prosthecobacter sp.]|uniref:YkgJ family cysteine cluster protein n=1 Tax=Prosthecobacter sp. TaxID=1965333 RepID=UPI003784E234
MIPEEFSSAATRLCTACGMCCDGTMFQIVRMQPGEVPAELGKLGLKIRCRGGEYYMEQPCSALREKRCTVYEQRPVRCRLFNCQQLGRLERGETTEAETMKMIFETRALVERVRGLIEQSGLREDGQALVERYERVASTPVNQALEPELVAVREELDEVMRKLKLRLNREFRLPPNSH